jgi:predicted fused transcriptional regulator/phosphomethylpyrimidine kinase
MEVIEHDGASMPWKIGELVQNSGGLSLLFYEGDGWGKGPLFVASGRDAIEVTTMAIEIARRYGERISTCH